MPHRAKGTKAGAILSKMQSDVRALNSSIMIISQKMKYLVRNEKVLGRNLLVLNKRLKQLESGKIAVGGEGASSPEMAGELKELTAQIQRNTAAIEELRSAVSEIQAIYAKSEDVKEMKFVIDSINPLEFVTYKDVEELIDEKLARKKHKARS